MVARYADDAAKAVVGYEAHGSQETSSQTCKEIYGQATSSYALAAAALKAPLFRTSLPMDSAATPQADWSASQAAPRYSTARNAELGTKGIIPLEKMPEETLALS